MSADRVPGNAGVPPAPAAGRFRLRPPANRLYAIVDTGFFGSEPATLRSAVGTLLDCGVRWIQLRAKGVPDLAAWRLAEAWRSMFEEASGADGEDDAPLLWINDNAAIAAALLAGGPRAGLHAGLHLGQDDLPPAVARLSVPPACPIGRSTHGRAQAEEADGDPAVDALAIGPVFGTTTKDRPDPVVGLAGVAQAREVTSKPLIGIGGIDADRAPRVIEAGADAVAVVSALDLRRLEPTCRELLRALR